MKPDDKPAYLRLPPPYVKGGVNGPVGHTDWHAFMLNIKKREARCASQKPKGRK